MESGGQRHGTLTSTKYYRQCQIKKRDIEQDVATQLADDVADIETDKSKLIVERSTYVE